MHARPALFFGLCCFASGCFGSAVIRSGFSVNIWLVFQMRCEKRSITHPMSNNSKLILSAEVADLAAPDAKDLGIEMPQDASARATTSDQVLLTSSRTSVRLDLCQRLLHSCMMLHVSGNFVRREGIEMQAHGIQRLKVTIPRRLLAQSHLNIFWNLSLCPGCVASSSLLRKTYPPRWTGPWTNHPRARAHDLPCLAHGFYRITAQLHEPLTSYYSSPRSRSNARWRLEIAILVLNEKIRSNCVYEVRYGLGMTYLQSLTENADCSEKPDPKSHNSRFSE